MKFLVETYIVAEHNSPNKVLESSEHIDFNEAVAAFENAFLGLAGNSGWVQVSLRTVP